MPVDVEQLLIAEGAVFMFPAQIAVLFADGEERGDGEVRHAEAGQHFADNVPARFRGADGFVHVHVEDGSSRIAALKFVLKLERPEQVARVVHGKLGAVRVITLPHRAGLDDVRIAFLVFAGETVRGAFRGRGFQVVQIAVSG